MLLEVKKNKDEGAVRFHNTLHITLNSCVLQVV